MFPMSYSISGNLAPLLLTPQLLHPVMLIAGSVLMVRMA